MIIRQRIGFRFWVRIIVLTSVDFYSNITVVLQLNYANFLVY